MEESKVASLPLFNKAKHKVKFETVYTINISVEVTSVNLRFLKTPKENWWLFRSIVKPFNHYDIKENYPANNSAK